MFINTYRSSRLAERSTHGTVSYQTVLTLRHKMFLRLDINLLMRERERIKPRLHFTPGNMLPDTSCIPLYPLAAVDKIVASLSPACCWIQRDTSRPWHKWIVITLPRYSQHVSRTNNMYPATCVRQHYMYPDTSCSSGAHVAGKHMSLCKRGIRDNRASRTV